MAIYLKIKGGKNYSMSLIKNILIDHTSNKIKNIYSVQKLTFRSSPNSEIAYLECFQCIITCLLSDEGRK